MNWVSTWGLENWLTGTWVDRNWQKSGRVQQWQWRWPRPTMAMARAHMHCLHFAASHPSLNLHLNRHPSPRQNQHQLHEHAPCSSSASHHISSIWIPSHQHNWLKPLTRKPTRPHVFGLWTLPKSSSSIKSPWRHLLIASEESKLTAIKSRAITIRRMKLSAIRRRRGQHKTQSHVSAQTHKQQSKEISYKHLKFWIPNHWQLSFCVLCLRSVFIFVAPLNDAEEECVV